VYGFPGFLYDSPRRIFEATLRSTDMRPKGR
jgi:hypothetical protein